MKKNHKMTDKMMIPRYIILTLGLLIMIVPMLYMVLSSLKDNDKTFIYPPVLFPSLSELSLNNYQYILENVTFFRYLGNTLFVAIMTVLIAIVVSTTLAYSFARLDIPGKKIVFGFIISVMLLPGLAMIIPQFELAARMKLINNIWGVILFYAAWVTPFSTFLLKGYIEDNVPKEMDESIFIDGGSIFSVYRYIIIPIASPAVAAISISNFLYPFEELGWSQQILKLDELRTLPVAITMFFQAHSRTDWGYVFAMTTLAMIPVIAFYLLLQKYFISGMTSGAIKG
ncbi:MAG: carbohydrate ABC transporter permease [Tenericutes bacterium HGW-Tenericutes-1]|jgi:multiple sugar transport system permease protein|nr:MAG: carbohydrate ABC transporter permease [Tenericutes bacterium HGW-Tenericutes-1]